MLKFHHLGWVLCRRDLSFPGLSWGTEVKAGNQLVFVLVGWSPARGNEDGGMEPW